uniref:Uncharacterized protein n=1 Tax=Palpitomonas bilix TaxID=652834 RepID=A0A7S3LU44_9EUKA|mmetsp:Transcript_46818/g.120646  ORF Transcript_46818/g.120646 Transcript_46818/m.120646 type:complete len:323 (+) Transcript_46818:106-1074(+)
MTGNVDEEKTAEAIDRTLHECDKLVSKIKRALEAEKNSREGLRRVNSTEREIVEGMKIIRGRQDEALAIVKELEERSHELAAAPLKDIFMPFVKQQKQKRATLKEAVKNALIPVKEKLREAQPAFSALVRAKIEKEKFAKLRRIFKKLPPTQAPDTKGIRENGLTQESVKEAMLRSLVPKYDARKSKELAAKMGELKSSLGGVKETSQLLEGACIDHEDFERAWKKSASLLKRAKSLLQKAESVKGEIDEGTLKRYEKQLSDYAECVVHFIESFYLQRGDDEERIEEIRSQFRTIVASSTPAADAPKREASRSEEFEEFGLE